MKKGLTEIVFILDRSGSMGGLESDTIGGYNALLEKQRAEEGEAILTTVLFDDRVEILHDRMDLREVRNITREDYYVRGCTALLDAVGETVERIHTAQKYARPEDRPEKTVVVITTDGMENASRRYTYAEVKRMVERRREATAGNSSSWEQTSMRPRRRSASESTAGDPRATSTTASAP